MFGFSSFSAKPFSSLAVDTSFIVGSLVGTTAVSDDTTVNTGQGVNLIVTGVSASTFVSDVLVWGNIMPNQTPSWSSVTTSQTASYNSVTTSQTPSWGPITTSQTPIYSVVSPNQTPNWEDVAT